ncbi:dTDP-glucose 4,6-dehydratase [candidate division LCP-89 bacterium B3_LCP]|uniref:dTDP-glucose 4,6-dehydratase n=1 Tax=candidate division LCP-89 bacterium B3_LCP TaxID=2012998 RepID=A0A532V609_UNCL8|nr:MAG: dTDP-glucose 4,6-dehydratase [candidate division LCP-89 bacterium B3_LCP]
MNILITGGAGFIGSNFVHFVLKAHSDVSLVNVDALTYCGNLENLSVIEDDPRYKFVKADIADSEAMEEVFKENKFDAVINFAAETHVDRSITGPAIFLHTNVFGTQVLLDMAMKYGLKRFVQISTDEVYGSLPETGVFTEETPLAPNSPYSASKASADMLVRAYVHTYGLNAVVTRCSNNYGPYQFPEKLIPLMITNALEDQPLPVYGDGMNVRDWLHVEDHCRAVWLALNKGRSGEIYNIGGSNEWHNLALVKELLNILGKPESLITFVKDRPGHDRRYAIDSSKIRNELAWKPTFNFADGLRQTVEWTITNENWWRRVKSGEYQSYYKEQYEL